jgi:hypothetical protein
MYKSTPTDLKKSPKVPASLIAAVITLSLAFSGAASAAVVQIDGIFDPITDNYTNLTTVEWSNDHHSQFNAGDPSNTTKILWNDHTDGLYVYGEVGLKAKSMIWGAGVSAAELALYYQGWCDAPADGQPCTHHNKDGVGGDPSSGTKPLVLDYGRATGSEKFVIAEGGITIDLKDWDDNATTQTSVDWVLKNGCDKIDCDKSETPMSFETLFTDDDEITQVLDWLALWDNYNNSNSLISLSSLTTPVGLVAHLSPEQGGVIPPVPVPAAFWLFGTALIGFIGMSRRTNLA